ncbi:MAG: TIR domain-containing protein [Hyphomicrobiales bacterium]|nr:TIR domain-containing protein [Hyphomicrobiales bacterium]
MSKIVISYRRSDTQAIAGRIRDKLVSDYGVDCVYMDIDSIPPGLDFRDHLDSALASSDVLIAIIGPKWLGRTRGKRARIDDPSDPVRVEIETAFRLHLSIVPVLVNNAEMPTESDLPDSIKDLAYRNAAIVDEGRDFHQHMNRLIHELKRLHRPAPARAFARKRTSIATLLLGGVAAAGGLWWVFEPTRHADVPMARPAVVDGATLAPTTGGPMAQQRRKRWPAPSPTSYWELTWDGSKVLVFQEATGQAREYYFAEVTKEMAAQGIGHGDLWFEGWLLNDAYEGKAYLYAGDCGAFAFQVQGPVIANTTVELSGKMPRINRAPDCAHARDINGRFLFDDKSMVIRFKTRK